MTEKLPASRKGWKPAFSLKIPKGETRTIRVRTRLPVKIPFNYEADHSGAIQRVWVTGG
jgi:hypothetical protein